MVVFFFFCGEGGGGGTQHCIKYLLFTGKCIQLLYMYMPVE